MVKLESILNAKILIVDDMQSNVELFAEGLTECGYTCVRTTTDPTQVAGMHRDEPFDLILLDLQMPKMDGFDVMEELKKVERDYLPVLVITGDNSKRLQALEQGAKDFVSKPFNLAELRARVHNMLEVRLLYRELSDINFAINELQ